jgi:hypothetical protein
MSNSAGIAIAGEPLPPSRAVVPRAPHPPPPQSLSTDAPSQRRGRSLGFQARPARQETGGSGPGRRPAQAPAARPAVESHAPRHASKAAAGYLAQLLAQAGDGPDEGPLQRHRDGPSLGSAAYRRAGGEPAVYPEAATLFRLAV